MASSTSSDEVCTCKTPEYIASCKEKSITDHLIESDTINESIWAKLRPPKLSEALEQRLVSARQLEVVRAKLAGKIGAREAKLAKPQASKDKKKAAKKYISQTRI